MHFALTVIAAALGLLACIPYVLDTVHGKTHPNLVTWITWSLVNVIQTWAAFSAGAGATAYLLASYMAGTLTILIFAFRHSVKRYTAFDIGCQAFALIGIILWRITKDPAAAIAIMQVIILVAAMPTWRHAWKSPHAETWQSFALATLAAVITFFNLTSLGFVSLVPLFVSLLNGGLMVCIILGRRWYLGRQLSGRTQRG